MHPGCPPGAPRSLSRCPPPREPDGVGNRRSLTKVRCWAWNRPASAGWRLHGWFESFGAARRELNSNVSGFSTHACVKNGHVRSSITIISTVCSDPPETAQAAFAPPSQAPSPLPAAIESRLRHAPDQPTFRLSRRNPARSRAVSRVKETHIQPHLSPAPAILSKPSSYSASVPEGWMTMVWPESEFRALSQRWHSQPPGFNLPNWSGLLR